MEEKFFYNVDGEENFKVNIFLFNLKLVRKRGRRELVEHLFLLPKILIKYTENYCEL